MKQKKRSEPTRPKERWSFRFAREGDRLAFELRDWGQVWRTACFMLFWLAGWTVAGVIQTNKVIAQPTLGNVSLGVVVWIIWLVILCLLVHGVLGRDRFLLDPRGAAMGRWFLFRFGWRQVPLEDVRSFHAITKPCDRKNDRFGYGVFFGVEMQTRGPSLEMAWGLSPDEQEWLVEQLNEHLASLRAASDGPAREPVRPESPPLRLDREGERLTLLHRRRNGRERVAFLVAFALWTCLCAALVVGMCFQPCVFGALLLGCFGVPWIGLAGGVLHAFLERSRLVLDRGGASFERWAIVRLERRLAPLDTIRPFRAEYAPGGSRWSVQMGTLGRPLTLLSGLSEDQKSWLLGQLNDHLASLQTDPASRPSTRTRELALTDRAVARPDDCRWRREDSALDVVFVRRGRPHWPSLVSLAMVCVFWNCAVAIFLGVVVGFVPVRQQPQGVLWWATVVGIVPFALIGLGLLFGVLRMAIQPARRWRWIFARAEVRASRTWFGLGASRSWPVAGLRRLEVRPDRADARRRLLPSSDPSEAWWSPYRLLLIDRDNRTLCSLGRLTEGEARWIGDVILRERPEWFGGR